MKIRDFKRGLTLINFLLPCLLVGLVNNAGASLILTPPVTPGCSSKVLPPNQNKVIASFELNCAGDGTTSVSTVELYKKDQGGSESGSFADAYTTSFFNTPTDPEDAEIVKDPTGTAIDPSLFSGLWALAKDGNADPTWYAWDLLALSWNGTETLRFEDLWVGSGAISNVSIRGVENGSPGPGPGPGPVPAPAPLALFGLGGLMLGWSMRRKARA